MSRERINELDLLRFLAAIAVVLFHYSFRGHAYGGLADADYPWIIPLSQYGYLGVHCFFMISGFVIIMSAHNASAARFIASRAIRLYPAFWICCTTTFIVIKIWDDGRFSATFYQYLMNLTLTSGFYKIPSIDGAYWSIFFEIQFYILVLILVILRQTQKIEIWLGAWLLYLLKVKFIGLDEKSEWFMPQYAPYFIAGSYLYLIRDNNISLSKLIGIGVSYWLCIELSVAEANKLRPIFNTDLSPTIAALTVSSFFLLLGLVATRNTGKLATMKFIKLGALTYPLYLIHQYIGYISINRLHDKINIHLLFWGLIAGSILAAYGIHKYFELPISQFMKRALIRNRSSTSKTSSAPEG